MSRGLEEIRNMLDVLMGKERNDPLDGSSRGRESKFYDDDFCKMYLVDFCPHDLFPNTKSDLGTCMKVHSDQMKEAYDKCEGSEKEGYSKIYEEQMLSFLENLIFSVDAKIRRGNLRIDAPLPSDQAIKYDDLPEDKKEKINELNAQVSTYLKQAERAGMAGRIDEAEAVSKQVAALRRQVEKLHSHATPFEMYVQRDKSLRVCHICGAMQSAADSASRFESHVIGKQHIGFEKVRAFIEELETRRTEREEKRRLHDSLKRQRDGAGTTSDSKRNEDGEVGRSDPRSADRGNYRSSHERDSRRDSRGFDTSSSRRDYHRDRDSRDRRSDRDYRSSRSDRERSRRSRSPVGRSSGRDSSRYDDRVDKDRDRGSDHRRY